MRRLVTLVPSPAIVSGPTGVSTVRQVTVIGLARCEHVEMTRADGFRHGTAVSGSTSGSGRDGSGDGHAEHAVAGGGRTHGDDRPRLLGDPCGGRRLRRPVLP